MIVENEHFSSLAKFPAWAESFSPQSYGWVAIGLVLFAIFLYDKISRRNRRSRYTYRPTGTRNSRRNGDSGRNHRPDARDKPALSDHSRPPPASGARGGDDFLVIASDNTPARPVENTPAMTKPITLVQQMEAVQAAEFQTIPLLNREEAKLLPLLESLVRKHGDGHRVMAQTSLGELIRPKNDLATTGLRSAAHASINSKRLDFAIINRWGHLVLAIEYQGSGHYARDAAFLHDAVKSEAIRKANVDFYAVPANYTTEDVARRVRAVLVPPRPDTPPQPSNGPVGGLSSLK